MRQLNPRALEYLNALSRFGSLRKAAARLSVDPATVSRLLNQLEQSIGLPVWDRSNSRKPITAAGHELLLYYRQMCANEAAALSRIHDLKELQRGEVSIAIGEGFISDLISHSLQSFRASPVRVLAAGCVDRVSVC
jgi:DNA-binding transcriptional LysR family regulator